MYTSFLFLCVFSSCIVHEFHKGTRNLILLPYIHVGTTEITDLCSGGCIISGRKDQTMYMLAESQADL